MSPKNDHQQESDQVFLYISGYRSDKDLDRHNKVVNLNSLEANSGYLIHFWKDVPREGIFARVFGLRDISYQTSEPPCWGKDVSKRIDSLREMYGEDIVKIAISRWQGINEVDTRWVIDYGIGIH